MRKEQVLIIFLHTFLHNYPKIRSSIKILHALYKIKKLFIYFLFINSGDNSHSAALCKSKSAENMEVVGQNALSKSKSAIISALRNTYFAASNDLPY